MPELAPASLPPDEPELLLDVPPELVEPMPDVPEDEKPLEVNPLEVPTPEEPLPELLLPEELAVVVVSPEDDVSPEEEPSFW